LLATKIQDYGIFQILIDSFLIWLLVFIAIKVVFSNSRILLLTIFFGILLLINFITEKIDLKASPEIIKYIIEIYLIIVCIIMAPDLRRLIELSWEKRKRSDAIVMGNNSTKNIIIESALMLAKDRIGALITIEKYNTLDHFADRAIMMNSIVSKELISNIFIPNTPLHDGAIIIRGDQIVCAGAYFILSQREFADKTMGSRHRAALGISELSDSLTIVVSEEKGDISIALNGILIKIHDERQLTDYLDSFMR